MNCAECNNKLCYQGKDRTTFKSEIMHLYSENTKDLKIAEVSSHLEGTYYMNMTRLEETIAFAQEMAYKHVGVAFCIGLSDEGGNPAPDTDEAFPCLQRLLQGLRH